jgi:hypothetical protein
MKIISTLMLTYVWLLLLGACHPRAGIPSVVARDSVLGPATENYDTLDPVTRSHFRDVQAFLDFIKRPNSDVDVDFNTWNKRFRISNIDSLMGFITGDSLEIDDADSDRGKDSVKYSRTFIRKQMSGRKGESFDMISELSLYYTMPYAQYSHLQFASDKSDSNGNLNVSFSEFVLYFRVEKGSSAYKLYRIESDHISDL